MTNNHINRVLVAPDPNTNQTIIVPVGYCVGACPRDQRAIDEFMEQMIFLWNNVEQPDKFHSMSVLEAETYGIPWQFLDVGHSQIYGLFIYFSDYLIAFGY